MFSINTEGARGFSLPDWVDFVYRNFSENPGGLANFFKQSKAIECIHTAQRKYYPNR
jgi:hypothetical protein